MNEQIAQILSEPHKLYLLSANVKEFYGCMDRIQRLAKKDALTQDEAVYAQRVAAEMLKLDPHVEMLIVNGEERPVERLYRSRSA